MENRELVNILIETAKLLTESTSSLWDNNKRLSEVCNILKDVNAPKYIKLSASYLKRFEKDIEKDGYLGEFSVCICEYHDKKKDKSKLSEIKTYVTKLNSAAKKYKYTVTYSVDEDNNENLIQIWLNN